MVIYEQNFRQNGLSPTQLEILRIVGKNKVVLEIGSSSGYMTKAFLDNDCIVDVIEINKEAVSKIPKQARTILNQSIEDEEIYEKLGTYDFIIMADVLEHLIGPGQVLKRLLKVSSIETNLIISLPNVACWAMRKQLFFKGDFEYNESGLLDKTHLHFYTINTLPKMLGENEWKVDKIVGTIIRFPFEGLISKIPILGWIFKKVFYQILVSKYKNLAYYHFLVIATKNEKS